MNHITDPKSHIAIDQGRAVRSRIFHELTLLAPEERGRVWHKSSGDRTAHYLEKLRPAISEACGATWSIRELHRFDAVFGTEYTVPETGAAIRIPKLFVESENVPDSAHHEIERLCWSFAPLRMLITVAEWHPAQFPETSSRKRLRERWDGFIQSYDRSLRQWGVRRNGVISIMVGECGTDGILRFYSYEYREHRSSFFPGPDEEEVTVIGPAPKPS